MNGPESPFFLSVNVENPKPGQCWYKKTPMGINKLYGIMKKMMTDTGLSLTDKRITPYSVRKHLIQKLNDEGIPANHIVQISGHKNINSLNNYSNLNPAQSRNISNILSNVPALHVIQPVIRETAPPVAPATVSSCTKEFQSIPGYEFSGILTNAVIHGDVHIHLQQRSETQSLSQTTQYVSGRKTKSSGIVSSQPSKWRRIISSDTDSE
ncbi:hypothetical protein ACJMK2_014251 [Sinanodonta woodiana]|uniref:Tyr recombinase domain-containing protein n=1 Tax=Sinanodonta woodiana TaxID=1069815 RepID=A0ABD3V026_SINWO